MIAQLFFSLPILPLQSGSLPKRSNSPKSKTRYSRGGGGDLVLNMRILSKVTNGKNQEPLLEAVAVSKSYQTAAQTVMALKEVQFTL